MVRCARCHRVITDPAAIEAGYGAKCYAKEFGKKLKSPARPRKGKTATQPKSTAERQIIGQLTVYDILAAHEKSADQTGGRTFYYPIRERVKGRNVRKNQSAWNRTGRTWRINHCSRSECEYLRDTYCRTSGGSQYLLSCKQTCGKGDLE